MNKQEKIAAFNPSCIGLTNAGIFGFPFTVEEADYVVIPIPWESTASFGNGTQDAPAMIYEASNQLDFYFPDFPDVWNKGIAMTDIDKTIKSHSIACRKIVEKHIALLESGAKSYGIYFHTTYKTLELAGISKYYWRYIDRVIFKGFTESLLSTVRSFNLFDAREMYSSLGDKDIPSLVIWGTNDGVVPYDGSLLLKKSIPQVTLETIDEGTHDITYRQPTQVGEAMKAFLLTIK